MNKIYINITNKCQYLCPFCCMYSNPNNDIFMDFDTFKNIIDKCKYEEFIIQLEGGEPLLHPHLCLFLEYCSVKDNIAEIVIDTNGALLKSNIDKIVEIAERNKKHITIKPSINNYILNKRIDVIKEYDNISSACEFLDFVSFEFNIRYSDENDKLTLLNILSSFLQKKYVKYNMYQLNRYGRASKDKSLPNIVINEVFDEWEVYSCDGRCFNRDLIKRSIYEKSLLK